MNERADAAYNTGSGGSTTYERWGRKTCPDNDATLVYEGFMGGGSNVKTGDGTMYLCLPLTPSYKPSKNITNHPKASIFTSMYETDQYMGYDAPCAVCYVPRTAKLMIPGINTCPDDSWTTEYIGLLKSSFDGTVNSKQYVCIDKDPETVTDRKHFSTTGGLYPVIANCLGMPCGPGGYTADVPIACVICTK